MVHLGTLKNASLTISTKPNSITVSLEKEKNTEVFSFDMQGRLWTALKENISYRRGLNGNIVAKWNSGNEILHRKWLTKAEQEQLLTHAHQTIRELVIEIKNQNTTLSPQLSPVNLEQIEVIANTGLKFYEEDLREYLNVYKPVGILPPDQYNSVVLQATEGCSFNTCTFCDFYKTRPFLIKKPEQFEEHVNQVINFIGKGMNLRRTIFLGDANALVIPMKKLVPLLEILHRKLDVEALGGIFAFLDGFSGDKKKAKDYAILKTFGVEKIYIGLESGDDQLLQFLKKPGKAQDVLNAVKEIKKGGLSVGVIILLGAGGKQYQEQHIKNTVKLINQMNLDADDLVYFSELIENSTMEYTKNAYQNNLIPLTPLEREKQGQIMQQQFKFKGNDVPHISRYDIRDFVY